MVEEVIYGKRQFVKVTGLEHGHPTTTVMIRGSNKMVMDEAERSFHDALCVTRCLIQKPYLVPGGGAAEIALSRHIDDYSKTINGTSSYCATKFSESLEIVPYTLAENAGLDPITIVTGLITHHKRGKKFDGFNVRKGSITNMVDENVVQPLMVTSKALELSTECAMMIIKIDDIIRSK